MTQIIEETAAAQAAGDVSVFERAEGGWRRGKADANLSFAQNGLMAIARAWHIPRRVAGLTRLAELATFWLARQPMPSADGRLVVTDIEAEKHPHYSPPGGL